MIGVLDHDLALERSWENNTEREKESGPEESREVQISECTRTIAFNEIHNKLKPHVILQTNLMRRDISLSTIVRWTQK
jgi:hypothetical protein